MVFNKKEHSCQSCGDNHAHLDCWDYEDSHHIKTKRKKGSLSVLGAVFFLIIVGVFVITARIPPLILALYMVVSLITFIMYAVDKSAATKGAWRTHESTLHLLSIAGGWPGALFAQQKLRHKTKKQSFRFIFWVTVLLNCGAFIWLLTPTGASTLQSLVDSVGWMPNVRSEIHRAQNSMCLPGTFNKHV